MRPLSISRLSLKNLYQKSFRTTCLVIIVAIFASTLFGGSLMIYNLSSGIKGMAARLGADVMIVPHGYEKQLETALLRGEPSSFYLKADLVEKLRQVKGVEAASAQLFMASLNAGCCTVKVQLIGFDPNTDFVVEPWLKQQLKQDLTDNEVVVGSHIIPDVGEEIIFFNQPFRIAAKMERTGMGFDTSVFMTISAAQDLMKKAGLVIGDTESFQDYASSIFLRIDPNYVIKDVVNDIMQNYAIDYNLDFVITKGFMSNISQGLTGFSILVYSLSAIFWVLAVIVIFTLFSTTLNERKRELAILRILGASRAQLIKMLLGESLLICIAGAIAGIVISGILLFSFNALICQTIGLPCAAISPLLLILYAFAVLVITAITGPLANIYSVFSITRFDIYASLREGE